MYDDVLRHEPAMVQAAAGRVRALWMRREVEQARHELDVLRLHDIPGGIALLRSAIAVDGGNTEAYLQLASTLSWHGDVAEAWSTLREVEQRFGHTSPETSELEGWMRLKQLDDLADSRDRADCLRMADAAFARTLREEPRHVGARSGRAVVRRYRSGLAAGSTVLEAELAIDPRSPQLNTDFGWLICFDEPLRSIDHFLTALAEAPYLTSARAGLVTALLTVDRSEEAKRHLAELTERYPHHLETLQTVSYAATMAQDHDTALQVAEQAVAEFSDDPEAHYRRADVLLAMKRYDGASADGDELSAAVRRWPGHVGLRWQKAMRAEADGWIAEARQDSGSSRSSTPTTGAPLSMSAD